MFYAESSAAVHVGFGAYWLLLALVVSSWVSVGFLSFSLLLVCGARKPCTFILPAMSAATIFFVGANPKRRKFNQVSVIKHAIGLHGLLSLPFFFSVFFSKVFGPFVIVPGPAIEILRRPFSLRRPFARMRPASASLHAAEKKERDIPWPYCVVCVLNERFGKARPRAMRVLVRSEGASPACSE